MEEHPNLFLRLLRFPLVFLALLYGVLTYLYLSGYFFRTAFTQGPLAGLAASAMTCAMMLLVYASLTAWVERRPVGELALAPALREAGTGLVLGFALYSACIFALALLGVYRIDGFNSWQVLLPGLAAPLATGVFEELLFRGGVFRLAERWFGSWIALAISSIVFGVVHLENDAATMRGILSISTWAGILLAATFLMTQRLWLGIGLHAAWNYTQGTVYSGIVSGNAAPTAGFVKSTMQGPDWLTGGTFGVEASMIALVICSAAGLWMVWQAYRRGHIRPAPWTARR